MIGAREYDAFQGRFISVDPILESHDAQAINGYSYADNDPVNSSDPSGLMAIDDNGQTDASWVQAQEAAANNSYSRPAAGSTVACGKGCEDPTSSTGNVAPRYNDFEPIAGYITKQINQHASGSVVRRIAKAMSGNNDCSVSGVIPLCFPNFGNGGKQASQLAKFANLERQGGAWDQKTYLMQNFDINGSDLDSEYSAVPGTSLRIRYDIWANIHYGYVGAAAGIPSSTLIRAQNLPTNPVTGRPDPADTVSVKLGIQLYNSTTGPLTRSQLTRSIIQELPKYVQASRGVAHPVVLSQ